MSGERRMSGGVKVPAPLRPGDPRTLGSYELLGRLGEGGMGTVYLARTPAGVQVAVKMVRADLAPDDEFRRRFRSEVNRVRQVPPFCTAEVLDADPDHEQPYLVVEYVDGPSLAEVVQERGPLTSSNLHGVAIGVATALTAIHGAGVIHRDLKPRNVLLAPGSPKVIDFGIARAMEATSQHTRTDQMVGTVAYMAPERFGPEAGSPLTPAADIFAWGGVVAYAGTGRNPFSADSPTATAARILTQPPDLTGLSGSLRELIAHSLEKEAGNRPTSRELLDLLLTAGPHRSPATVAALAHQPGLRAAAQEAQAATDYADARQLTAVAVPAQLAAYAEATTDHALAAEPLAEPLAGPPSEPEGGTGAGDADATSLVAVDAAGPTRVTSRVPAQALPVSISPAAPAAPAAPAGHTGQVAAAGVEEPVGEPADVDPRRPWVLPAAVALLVVALLGAVAIVAAYRPWQGGASPGNSTGPAGPGVPAPSPSVQGTLLFTDPLRAQRLWIASHDDEQQAGCSFADGLLVRRESTGSFRCKGPLDVQTPDQRVEVDVRLRTKGSCASIWFRFRGSQGYRVQVCEASVYVGTHKNTSTEVYKTFPLDGNPVVVGGPPTRIAVSARGDQVEVLRDGVPVGPPVTLIDPDITGGRVVLGIFTETPAPEHSPPYEVAFTDVSVWSLGV